MPQLISDFFGKTLSTSGISTSVTFTVGADTQLDDADLTLGTIQGTATNSTTVATTAATSIVAIDNTIYRSAKVQVQITQGSAYQASDILLIHDGTTANIIEYGSIATGSYLGNFSADISGSDARLLITMNSSSSATVKTVTQKITV
jgi:hypothetical protein